MPRPPPPELAPLDFHAHHAPNSTLVTGIIQVKLPRAYDPRSKAEAIRPCCEAVDLMFTHHSEDPNEATPDGETPLMAACAWAAHEQLLTTLIDSGADPGLLAKNGSSALSAAVFANSVPLVRLLLLHGGEGGKQAALRHGLDRLLHTLDVGLQVIKAQAVEGGLRTYGRYLQAMHWNRLLRQELTAWFAANAAAPHAEVGHEPSCRALALCMHCPGGCFHRPSPGTPLNISIACCPASC